MNFLQNSVNYRFITYSDSVYRTSFDFKKITIDEYIAADFLSVLKEISGLNLSASISV
jgi:hypothetical protein